MVDNEKRPEQSDADKPQIFGVPFPVAEIVPVAWNQLTDEQKELADFYDTEWRDNPCGD